MRRRHTTLIALFLLVGLTGACAIWLRSEQHQYALNRQLIAALVHVDDKQALTLVNGGADPNTRYTPTPVPSLPELVIQLLHRSSPPANDSPTALLIACGAEWSGDFATIDAQVNRPDDAQLVQAMVRHGANINVKSPTGATPLMWSGGFTGLKIANVLLEHGANVNAQTNHGDTLLMEAAI